ncbi:MupA/Atu3671 family FMN-dependent luciferase-like monooxygenase [Hydrogenophaga sp.]|uniref:MupA/Atu3671 family FMN-dependent luciferase-like monooxygenase n=1 Tax=Hydrogenophaga sp. TaxID=1904254 RepID=UPI002636CFD8|nr:MupA/Atu3671 family FMN-dependent luciferase-like monooxygenase [Hydrogenophaga sp.]MDM7950740.1 LLM class flavin-dependent oxidoreductase [Hydrogenophaga sp.]
MSQFSCVLMGNESLLIQCADRLLQGGDRITAVVTRSADIRAWALHRNMRVEAPGADLAERLAGVEFDWLFSIANLSVIPQTVLDQARRGAINFHDGPLPKHAGLNAPVWAILAGEKQHGVTWHMIEGGIDEGDIVKQRLFDMGANETALTLNTRCYEAAMESFAELLSDLRGPGPQRTPQDLSQRRYHARLDRPAAAARIDFAQAAESIVALVSALDHSTYWNPLTCAKVDVGGRVLLVSGAVAEPAAGAGSPGQVVEATPAGLVVATASVPVRLTGLRDASGQAVCPSTIAKAGDTLPLLNADEAQSLTGALAQVVAGEDIWRRHLQSPHAIDLPSTSTATGPAVLRQTPLQAPTGLTGDRLLAAVAAWVARVSGKPSFDLAYQHATAPQAPGYLSTWVPWRLEAAGELPFAAFVAQCTTALDKARRYPAFALDLVARDPAIHGLAVPQVGVSQRPGFIEGSAVTVVLAPDGGVSMWHDAARLPDDAAAQLAQRLQSVLDALGDASAQETPLGRLPIMSASEREQVLYGWNNTHCDYERQTCVHQFFESQVQRTPQATAVVFEGTALSYTELNVRANRVAHRLQGMGVKPGTLVGLYTQRSLDLLIGALAIQKAGGAYVPLDPAYPADRIALYIEDSGAPVIVAQSVLVASLPAHQAQVLVIDEDAQIASQPVTNLDSGVLSSDIAYMIYTSGSTGRPKGVMVEHRNVANFFRGMDDRIRHDPPGVWLAVTSLSFDISVLELFYTLARGFKLVLSSDENRALVSSGQTPISAQKMDFSLYYWGNDDGAGPKKYELLLEGAKFADQHGFCAVWTPERHFHAFGGPYPNPSVTGAAVAAVTKNIGVRAGSCVGPLHHPARIAEEWAVIDNLTNGRAALAIASGWQPDDFVLRPQNTPPHNKKAMFETIEQLRQLWRGEAVAFPTASGEMFNVITQPRPVSKALRVWVTTAGNPETWKEAGAIGANVLTHLLGQTVAEVADKIKIYHQALREAGHDPAQFTITLMLHTYVARDREQAREISRGPMKDYLRSAAGLIKQYAWAFPAFKKPVGVNNPFELDLRSLSEEEMEGILDFAFLRYFEDSGLFGTVDDCLQRVEELKAIGVGEVACLIDYGIPAEKVMESLYPLAEVLRRSNEPTAVSDDDFSIAAQIKRHGVTHLQCTPSMARMIAMNDEAKAALSQVKHLMIGGEALPGTLVAELGQVTQASIENMYGPTETTIWSSTETASAGEAVVNIGRPIANTQMYVLDDHQQPVPVGVPGELYIGGDGVTRGYWQRADLTAERFPADPFVRPDCAAPAGARMYRTGDLARWRADGRIDFLGRADFQVKIRGYRIELGEIEAVLESADGIRQAVVVAREDQPGDVRLVAYLRADPGMSTERLRDWAAARLPEHMVPAHFMTVDEFPLTPNRKVDRKALPAPTQTTQRERTEVFVEPENEIEQKIAAIWSRILGVPLIGAKDSFFALGGHSLLAVQAHREIKQALNTTRLSITDIFRFPTLAALAAHLDDKPRDTPEAAAESTERAQLRADAMSRRRAMRAGKEPQD